MGYYIKGNKPELFINGVNDTGWQGAGTPTDDLQASAAPLYLGSTDTPDNYYEGMIDELAIWNRSLTPAEILALYSYTAGRLILNLIGAAVRAGYFDE